MATQTVGQIFQWSGPEIPILGNKGPLKLIEAATQSYAKGAVLTLSSGKVAAAVSGDAANLMIAVTAATGTTNAAVNAVPILPQAFYAMNIYHATPASAVTAQTDLGALYDLVVDGSGYAVCDKGSTTDKIIRVVGFHPDHTIGDAYGLVIVQFVPSACFLQSTGGL